MAARTSMQLQIPVQVQRSRSSSVVEKENDAVERAVEQLNVVCKRATLDFALSVGAIVIDTLYAGDLDAWRSRKVKDQAFRRLAKHHALSMSAASLYRSVAIYEMCARLGTKSWRNISASHFHLVLPLAPHEQERFLITAESENWSVRLLKEHIVRRAQPRPADRGGRRRKSGSERAIEQMNRCVDACRTLAAAPDDPSPESWRNIIETSKRLHQICALLENRATRCMGTPSTPPPCGDHTEEVTSTKADENLRVLPRCNTRL